MSPTVKARPTLYKGIQMRSRLEADYAAHLDKLGYRWHYEPTCFASDRGQWLPDFSFGTQHYVELKPASLLRNQDGENYYELLARIDLILTRMTIAWRSEPDTCLELAFWNYGGDWPALSIYGYLGHPWTTDNYAAVPFAQLWPGMGQMQHAQALAGSEVA